MDLQGGVERVMNATVVGRMLHKNVWLILSALILALVAYETHHMAQLETEIRTVALDLDLGNPETTRLFRRTVLAQLESVNQQVHANAVIVADTSERITRLTCECPGGVCVHPNGTGKCDNPGCSPPDVFLGAPPPPEGAP